MGRSWCCMVLLGRCRGRNRHRILPEAHASSERWSRASTGALEEADIAEIRQDVLGREYSVAQTRTTVSVFQPPLDTAGIRQEVFGGNTWLHRQGHQFPSFSP